MCKTEISNPLDSGQLVIDAAHKLQLSSCSSASLLQSNDICFLQPIPLTFSRCANTIPAQQTGA